MTVRSGRTTNELVREGPIRQEGGVLAGAAARGSSSCLKSGQAANSRNVRSQVIDRQAPGH